MMKKYSWIAALVIALTFAFAGCSGELPPVDPNPLVEKTVFEMSTNAAIQALPEGALTFGAGDAGNPIKPLVRAGEDSHINIEVVKTAGKTSLKFTTVAAWGAGIDLPHAAFGFRDGDKVTVKGEVIKMGAAPSNSNYSGDPRVELNFKVGAESAAGTEKKAVGAFSHEDIEITATMITDVRGGSPAGIRISAYGPGAEVRIDEIKIVGLRPSAITKLSAPVLSVAGNVVSWTLVPGASGYEVYEGSNSIAKLGANATSLNLLTVDGLADGTYSITAVALGTAGSTSDSDKSAAVSATKDTPPPPGVKVMFGATEKTIELVARGSSTVELADGGNGYTLTYADSGQNINYANVYAMFEVSGVDLSGYTKVSFKYLSVAGDARFKDIEVLAGKTTDLTGYLSDRNPLLLAKSGNTDGMTTAASIDDLAFSTGTAGVASDLASETSIRFTFYIHASNSGNMNGATETGTTKYTISDIKFE